MDSLFTKIEGEANLLFEVPLKPLQGARFQPTGFPDLGAAVFQSPDGESLLVESAQSMANRLEAVCWDDENKDVVSQLKGISYIRVEQAGKYLTSSIIESHRINSPYILESGDKNFIKLIQKELGVMEKGPVNHQLLAKNLALFDICSLLHGAFLAKKELAGGRLRLARALSSFIEADGVRVAASGGVKLDHVDPKGNTNKGFGHVPFARDEYTAERITAYFNLDLAQLQGYRLGDAMTDLLLALAFFKIGRFLATGLRLRTACYLEPAGKIEVRRPEGFEIPQLAEIEARLPDFIAAAKSAYPEMAVTTAIYK